MGGLSFLSVFALVLILSYALIIQWSLKHWFSFTPFTVPESYKPGIFISIIIPARNEEGQIGACLKSLQQQQYPESLYEIIVIDDHSEDATAQVVEQLAISNVRLLRLADYVKGEEVISSYKKKSIELGLSIATGSLIATTDADCIIPPIWLRTIGYAHEHKGAELIAGPVLFYKEKNTLEYFQSLDFSGMMLLTAIGLSTNRWALANGANLAYTKGLFEKVNGFKGNRQIASGDDIFIVEKVMQQYPDKILFTKHPHANLTTAKPNWSGFFQQRLRWGTKNAKAHPVSKAVMGIPFLLSCLIVFSILAIPFNPTYFLLLSLITFVGKSICDYFLLHSASSFFHREDLMKYFLQSEVLHVLYLVTVGMSSLFIKKYTWKGRKSQ